MDAKKAITIALDYVKEIYPNATDLLIEETEISDDDKKWHITISFPEASLKGEFIRSLMGHPRAYKVITIENVTGKVRSMKMRLPES